MTIIGLIFSTPGMVLFHVGSSEAWASDHDQYVFIPFVIAGRSSFKVEKALDKIRAKYPGTQIDVAIFDMHKDLEAELTKIKPFIVINTCGPFQLCDYTAEKVCIQQKIHYIDLADGRDYVTGFSALDAMAKENNVVAITGASTVPGLSSAVIEHYKNQFSKINSLIYGITPGQKTQRGLATTKAILTYLGKPIKPPKQKHERSHKKHYGWQDAYCQQYPEIGKRWMGNCDIPDLDIFPEHYGIKELTFSAGMESNTLHFSMWILSWMVRLGLPIDLQKHASLLLKMSHWFDFLGSKDGGMHVILKGLDLAGKPKQIEWYLIVKDGDGPQVPGIPSIVLAKKLLSGELVEPGARPCVAMISLEEYMAEMRDFAVQTFESAGR